MVVEDVMVEERLVLAALLLNGKGLKTGKQCLSLLHESGTSEQSSQSQEQR